MAKKSAQPKILRRGFRVVALGGGTGLSALLRGLKEHCVRRSDDHPTPERPISDLVAIVTVTDDGGSSGRLRRENRILPPGDIRNCMVALSKDEALLGRLFQYRFKAGHGLIGHRHNPIVDQGTPCVHRRYAPGYDPPIRTRPI